MSAHFPKTFRLSNKYQFLRVIRQGKRHVGRYLIMDVVSNKQHCPRLGITVSKKFGNAVARNRFKRLVREVFRNGCSRLSSNIDIHIKPRSFSRGASLHQLLNEFNFLLKSDVECSQ